MKKVISVKEAESYMKKETTESGCHCVPIAFVQICEFLKLDKQNIIRKLRYLEHIYAEDKANLGVTMSDFLKFLLEQLKFKVIKEKGSADILRNIYDLRENKIITICFIKWIDMQDHLSDFNPLHCVVLKNEGENSIEVEDYLGIIEKKYLTFYMKWHISNDKNLINILV